MISCESISIQFGSEVVVENLSFSLQKGSSLALIGPNGCGKTSLLKILAGLARPSHGQVLYGTDTKNNHENPLQKNLSCLYLSALPAFFLDQSCLENLNLYLSCYNKTYHIDYARELFSKAGLSKKMNSPVRTLSTGQKRKLTLICAVLTLPDLLLADEPSLGLDKNGVTFCLEIFNKLKENNVSFIIASHDDVIVKWCSDVLPLGSFSSQTRNAVPKKLMAIL